MGILLPTALPSIERATRFTLGCAMALASILMAWSVPGMAGGFSNAAPMMTARGEHTATRLPSGTVLVTGGFDGVSHDLASAELYDPTTNSWSAAGALAAAVNFHSATLLA